VQTDDVICIFFEARLPYILRPNDNGSHRFIGEAYVRGVVCGEFMVTDLEIAIFELL
jgi:hypothetical protein